MREVIIGEPVNYDQMADQIYQCKYFGYREQSRKFVRGAIVITYKHKPRNAELKTPKE